MEEKIIAKFTQYIPKKMSAKYAWKFLLYSLILVGLLFWFKHKQKQQLDKKTKVITEIHGITIE